MIKAVGRLLALGLLGCRVGASVLARRAWRPVSLPERLGAIPGVGLPLDAPVTIHWNRHQIPFIAADSDHDLAVALGIVHAHLRLGQLELLRRTSQGRLSEVLGPIAVEVDRLIRTLDFGRAVPAMLAALPGETRSWLEGFVAGINHYVSHVERLPFEFAALGLEREKWRVADVLTLGRLASADVTWFVWFRLFRHHGRADWPEIWHRLTESEISPSIDGGARGTGSRLAAAIEAACRSGSNAFALSGARSAGQAPVLAADPHLSITLPNLWLVAGYRSRSHHAVGLMLPGIPFVAQGRNPWIAWGGTNLHAASSGLCDVTEIPPEAIRNRVETIGVRWSRDRRIAVRETAFGPIVSDAPLLRWSGRERLALRWIGHGVSDEITAMLTVNRARSWAEFRAALGGFAIPGQNLIYADTAGHIGQTMAARIPAWPADGAARMIAAADAAPEWDRPLTSRDLPVLIDPPEGYVASANNRPHQRDITVGWFFSPDDRVMRLRELLAQDAPLTRGDVAAAQIDVLHRPALPLRDWLVRQLDGVAPATRRAAGCRDLIAALEAWDGRYHADSTGALAFELLLYHVSKRLIGRARLAAYAATWRSRGLIADDLMATAPDKTARAITHALPKAARRFRRFGVWGAMHRVRLAHPLAALPVLDLFLAAGEAAASGSSETLLKTAHAMTDRRHVASYGSTARCIIDLSDLDRNSFALLGGQDGWLGSTTAADQWSLWRNGEYVDVPLGLETVQAQFPHRTVLTP